MGDNILTAIDNIIKFESYDLRSYASKYLNRINAVGEQLEFFIKDALANSLDFPQNKKELAYSRVFSYSGNQNNPPDVIIKESDAFEVKKIESPNSVLALNSSPPKNKLLSNDIRITGACRNCEKNKWAEKDLFYVVGHAIEGKIKYLFFVQGTCYAANSDVYDKIHSPIKKEIGSVLDSLGLEKGETVELGKIRKADPLGITELRIRGMWQIQNPLSVFKEFCKIGDNEKFHLFALIKKDKYNSFPREDSKKLESNKDISIKEIRIKDPNNPVKFIDAKLISFREK